MPRYSRLRYQAAAKDIVKAIAAPWTTINTVLCAVLVKSTALGDFEHLWRKLKRPFLLEDFMRKIFFSDPMLTKIVPII